MYRDKVDVYFDKIAVFSFGQSEFSLDLKLFLFEESGCIRTKRLYLYITHFQTMYNINEFTNISKTDYTKYLKWKQTTNTEETYSTTIGYC